MRAGDSLRPDQRSLILPADRWRGVLTWKPLHVARLATYTSGDDVIFFSLGREPDNDVDRNAVLVYDKVGPLGYLRSSLARWLARPIDRLAAPVLVEGRVGRSGGEKAAYVRIGGRNNVLAFLRRAAEQEQEGVE